MPTIQRLIGLLVVLVSALPAHLASAQPAEDPFATHVRPTDPLTPEQQQQSFRLPPGFEIQLVASEPQIQKPMNMAFDGQGRLWVTDTVEYPYAAPLDRPGRDRVVVLQDTNGDGRADKVTTFAEGLNIPIGLYPYGDGVIVFSIPHIWYLRDTDGDGRADQRHVLYGPMGYERDTHGMNNAFRRGFDGWLYACHGFNNETQVQGRDGHQVRMQSGNTYRMRLDGRRIEQFTWGQVNPFGMTMDDWGNLFTADCHSKPIYQLVRNAYYPSFGKPHDGLGFAPSMMEHLHGSTAIAGVACYLAEQFPSEYRGDMFVGNVMTSRVNRNRIEYHGATAVAIEQADLVSTSDPWFRPVDLQLGPDGALYVADFYNRIIGHYEVPLEHPGRDRSRGRIWRIVYTGDDPTAKPAATRRSLDALSLDELIDALDDANLSYRLLVMNHLVDDHGNSAADAMRQRLSAGSTSRQRVHLLWALERTGRLAVPELLAACDDADAVVRVHAMRILAERSQWTAEEWIRVRRAAGDSSATVRMAAADALARQPAADNVMLLVELLRNVADDDPMLKHALRMALRDQLSVEDHFQAVNAIDSKTDRQRIADVCLALSSPAAARYLLQYVDQWPRDPAVPTYFQHAARYLEPSDLDRLVALARRSESDDLAFQIQLWQAIHAGATIRVLPSSDDLQQWGSDLATRLLASIDEDSAAWKYVPLSADSSTDNPWMLQPRRAAAGGRLQLISSFPLGEQRTGILRSRPFVIPRQMTFDLAGHIGFPDQPVVARNFVRMRLVDDGSLVREVVPPRNDVAQRIQWDLPDHAGQRGYLEIVDGDTAAAYAWIAVGRFRPAVVAVPRIAPHEVSVRRQMSLQIIAQLRLADRRPDAIRLLTDQHVDSATRETAARTLLEWTPVAQGTALALAVGDAATPENLREQAAALIGRAAAGQAVATGEEVQVLLATLLKQLPHLSQQRLALEWASDADGSRQLLTMVEQGQLPAGMLRSARLVNQLVTLLGDTGQQRIQLATQHLPGIDASRQQLVSDRVDLIRRSRGDSAQGALLFEKHCAVCHQLAGKGAVVGPQLDGIGQRGLQRIVEDILDPNRNVDVAFRTATLVLDDGRVVSGLVRRDEAGQLVLVNQQGQEFSVPLNQIDQRSTTSLSLMPENLVESLEEQAFVDLVQFLASQRSTGPTDGAHTAGEPGDPPPR